MFAKSKVSQNGTAVILDSNQLHVQLCCVFDTLHSVGISTLRRTTRVYARTGRQCHCVITRNGSETPSAAIS